MQTNTHFAWVIPVNSSELSFLAIKGYNTSYSSCETLIAIVISLCNQRFNFTLSYENVHLRVKTELISFRETALLA